MNSDQQCKTTRFHAPLLLNTNLVKQEPKIAGYLGQPLTQPLSYNQLLLNRVLIFDIHIYKVFKWPWRHFTSLKLCKCSQIPYPSAKVSSTSNITKPITIGLHSTHTMLRHFAREKTEGELSNLWCNTGNTMVTIGPRRSWKVLDGNSWKPKQSWKTVLEKWKIEKKPWKRSGTFFHHQKIFRISLCYIVMDFLH